LFDNDHFFSIDDFYDLFIEESQESVRGTADNSEAQDHNYALFSQYFDLIRFRSGHGKELYPFSFSDNAIELINDLNRTHLFYIFLLISSNLAFVDRSERYYISHAFEDFCCQLLKSISPSDSVTDLFGTSRESESSKYRGPLKHRIIQLAESLRGITTKSFDSDAKYNVPAGDGGLDIVSYHSLYDTNPFIPMAFAQCACSYEDWVEKQNSISIDIWRKRIEGLAPYIQFTFVPFYYRDAGGAFENSTSILSCLIDRYRILELAGHQPCIAKAFADHPISNTVKKYLAG
jgi:hypothetical protein